MPSTRSPRGGSRSSSRASAAPANGAPRAKGRPVTGPGAPSLLAPPDLEDADDPASGPGSGAAPAPPKLDGRRTHVVDRALDYVALHAQGLTVTQIARRRRRSKGYVSILLRLGGVLAALPPGEVAAFRSPRVTWALAQRLVRADTPAAEVRAQLRYALGGFSTHNVDRRRRGLRAARGGAGAVVAGAASAVGVASAPSAGPPTGGVLTGWGFDPALLAADPAGFVRAHLERLLGVHRAVETRVGRELRLAGLAHAAGAHSLRRLDALMRAAGSAAGAAGATGATGAAGAAGAAGTVSAAGVASGTGAGVVGPADTLALTPAQHAALRALAVFEAGLGAAVRGAVAELEAAAARTTAVPRATAGLPRRPLATNRPISPDANAAHLDDVDADDLEADLHEGAHPAR